MQNAKNLESLAIFKTYKILTNDLYRQIISAIPEKAINIIYNEII